MRQRILYVISNAAYFGTHYLALAKKAQKSGYEVAVAIGIEKGDASVEKAYGVIQQAGISVFPLKFFQRDSLSFRNALKSFSELKRIYRQYDPVITHHISLKLGILGSLAAYFAKVPIAINTLGGLGYIFTDYADLKPSEKKFKQLWQFLIKSILKFIGRRAHFIVQNHDDKAIIASLCRHVHLVPGAGVSLKDFPSSPLPSHPPFYVVCLARLIKEKGIDEFVQAAAILKEKIGDGIEFILYGTPDPSNPQSFTAKDIEKWQKIVHWRGFCDYVAKAYQESHIVVLPSYREGLPKSLLEAASCARAIVTTDVPGCRDVVIHDHNGLHVPIRNAKALADAIESLIANPSLCAHMGRMGRIHVEKSFTDVFIFQKILSLYAQLS
jgi:glycosyltransferase involved in cell wall biosynthesis